MAVPSAPASTLKPEEVKGWFQDADQRRTVMKKWTTASLITTEKNCPRWADLCELLRVMSDDFTFVCDTLDQYSALQHPPAKPTRSQPARQTVAAPGDAEMLSSPPPPQPTSSQPERQKKVHATCELQGA